MSFTVEDGSGVAGANSLTSTDFFVQYCTDRGYTTQAAWATTRIQVALIKATDQVEESYGGRFSGVRSFPTTQALSWPRRSCWHRHLAMELPYNVVPEKIQAAVVELALIADSTDLAPTVDAEDYNTISETIGPIKTDYRRTGKILTDIYPKAARLVAPFLRLGSMQILMERG